MCKRCRFDRISQKARLESRNASSSGEKIRTATVPGQTLERGKGRNQVAASIKERNCDRQINKIYRDKWWRICHHFMERDGQTLAGGETTGIDPQTRLRITGGATDVTSVCRPSGDPEIPFQILPVVSPPANIRRSSGTKERWLNLILKDYMSYRTWDMKYGKRVGEQIRRRPDRRGTTLARSF